MFIQLSKRNWRQNRVMFSHQYSSLAVVQIGQNTFDAEPKLKGCHFSLLFINQFLLSQI